MLIHRKMLAVYFIVSTAWQIFTFIFFIDFRNNKLVEKINVWLLLMNFEITIC